VRAVRSRVLPWVEPETAFVGCSLKPSHAFWLDSADDPARNRFSYMGAGSEVVSHRVESGEDLLDRLNGVLNTRAADDAGLRFRSSAAGSATWATS